MDEEFIYELKVPLERVAVLIGTSGQVKSQIEKATNTTISVDSAEGDVVIKGDDGLNIFTAKEVVIAIARGFNPECAMLLLKPDYTLEVIIVKEYAKSKKSMLRLKGRVIGHEGKSRRMIELQTRCFISVFGKTVSIVGEIEACHIARTAVDMLLTGSQHANVFRWLEKKMKDKKEL